MHLGLLSHELIIKTHWLWTSKVLLDVKFHSFHSHSFSLSGVCVGSWVSLDVRHGVPQKKWLHGVQKTEKPSIDILQIFPAAKSTSPLHICMISVLKAVIHFCQNKTKWTTSAFWFKACKREIANGKHSMGNPQLERLLWPIYISDKSHYCFVCWSLNYLLKFTGQHVECKLYC